MKYALIAALVLIGPAASAKDQTVLVCQDDATKQYHSTTKCPKLGPNHHNVKVHKETLKTSPLRCKACMS